MRRARIRPTPVDEAERNLRESIRLFVFARDGGCILRRYPDAGHCFGEPTPHHLWKSGQGGPYKSSNLVTLCSSHNDGWVENHPDAAWAVGLVVRYGETIEDAWSRLLACGLVGRVPTMLDDERRIRR